MEIRFFFPNKYKIKESSFTNANIIGNKLIINTNSISETGEIILETNLYTNEPFHLFHNGDNQK